MISSISCHKPYSILSFWFEKELIDLKKKTSEFLFNNSLIMKYTWIKQDDVLNNVFFKKYL